MADDDRRGWALAHLAAGGVVVVLAIKPSSDPDLGFHLATGRAVLELGAIPATNVLSYAEPDHPWIAHQAIPATLFELAHRAAGFAGTLAIQIACVLLTALCLLHAARRIGARPGIAAAIVILGAWAAAFRFVERPLLFSNLALAVVLAASASAHAAARAGRSRDAVLRIGAAGLALSVAIHLHAGALFSAIALSVLAITVAIEARIPRADAWLPIPRAPIAILGALIGGIALAAITLPLYHPRALEVLIVPLRFAGDDYLRVHLVEFRSPIDLPLRVLAPYWAFVAVAAIVLALAIRRAPLPLIALVLMGIALSLRHGRFVDLAWILGAPPVAALASMRSPVLRAEPWIAAAIAVVAIADRASLDPPRVGPAPETWPALFDTVDDVGAVGPAFVQDGWAGPFLARAWPRERVFFHPAFEAYSTSHYRLYQSIRYGEPGWDRELDRFGVELVIMKHTSPRERELQHGAPNLRQHLARSEAWALIATDELGSVFVRRDGANAAIAATSPSGVDPDRIGFAGPPARARAGLEDVARRSPPSVRAAILVAIARASDGDRASAHALLDATEAAAPGDPRISLARAAIDRP